MSPYLRFLCLFVVLALSLLSMSAYAAGRRGVTIVCGIVMLAIGVFLQLYDKWRTLVRLKALLATLPRRASQDALETASKGSGAEPDQRSVEPRPFVGLVLAGGGAKGAYQIGVLNILLQEAGITFDAVAGTSIGALNGAMLVSGGVEHAERFWRSLTVSRLARLRLSLLPISLMLNILRFFGHPAYYTDGYERRLKTLAFGLALIAATAFFTFSEWLLGLPAQVGSVTGICTVCLVAVLFLSIPAWERLNLSVARDEALKGLVAEGVNILTLVASRTPVYVTIARREDTLRRDVLRTYPELRNALKRAGGEWSKAVEVFDMRFKTGQAVVPHYIRLNGTRADDATACLMASMALPFGLFRRINVAGGQFIDGGLADNTPIYPLVCAGCRRIFCVHLTPRPRQRGLRLMSPKDLRLHVDWVESLRRDAGYDAPYGGTLKKCGNELKAA